MIKYFNLSTCLERKTILKLMNVFRYEAKWPHRCTKGYKFESGIGKVSNPNNIIYQEVIGQAHTKR